MTISKKMSAAPFCGGLAHLFVGIIDSGFMADRLIERCQVLGFGGRV